MKFVTKTARTALLAVMACLLLASTAFATTDGSVWLKVSASEDGKSVSATIETDTTVTDGQMDITYDSSKLEYTGIVVDDAYVAMYSVNAEEPGLVRIAWVAPEAYETDGSGDGIGLIEVQFSGKKGNSLSMTGTANAADGTDVPVVQKGSPNTGDTAMPVVAACLAVLAVAGIATMVLKNQRRGAK